MTETITKKRRVKAPPTQAQVEALVLETIRKQPGLTSTGVCIECKGTPIRQLAAIVELEARGLIRNASTSRTARWEAVA
jgi:hypothetical protein